jgi:hypothetical protein
MKNILFLLISIAVVIILWTTPVLYPLKLLVVFFHESSHALATVLSGGEVAQLVLLKEQGGYVMSRGGSRFLVLNSGYLGSLIWGVIIYWLSVHTRFDKAALLVLGFVIALITLGFAGSLFTIVFGLLTGITLVLVARYLSQDISDFILRLIGLTSMLYVPLDIFSDTISRSQLNSDARMLATEYGGTTIMWGVVWLLISVFIIFICLRRSIFKKSAIRQDNL